MKYIMIETSGGQKFPFIFPEHVVHAHMASIVEVLIRTTTKTACQVVSAGFVSVGTDVEVHGESESLGGIKSIPSDAARIIIGESVAFAPDELIERLANELRAK